MFGKGKQRAESGVETDGGRESYSGRDTNVPSPIYTRPSPYTHPAGTTGMGTGSLSISTDGDIESLLEAADDDVAPPGYVPSQAGTNITEIEKDGQSTPAIADVD